jgi:hypothetical protein
MYIGNFASGTDSMDSDAEIENHERQLELLLLLFFLGFQWITFCYTDISKINDCEPLLLAP